MKKVLLLLVTVLLLAACQPKPAQGDAVPPVEPTTATAETAKPGQAAAATADAAAAPASRGPGDFDLADPAGGLDQLPAYQQVLSLSFEGTLNGEAKKTTTTFTRQAAPDAGVELTTLAIDGEPAQFYGQVGDVSYARTGDSPCAAGPLPAGVEGAALPAFRLESLPVVSGAEAAGQENLHGVPATHYTFDERAIGLQGQAKASGELWVAEAGGVLLRYTLVLEAPDGLLGPGIAGTQSWQYELTELESSAVALPEGCGVPEQAVQLPLMDGAEVTVELPGYVEYRQAAGAESVLSFYQQQAEQQGWLAEEPVEKDGLTRLVFRMEDGTLLQVSIRAGEGSSVVTLQTLEAGQE